MAYTTSVTHAFASMPASAQQQNVALVSTTTPAPPSHYVYVAPPSWATPLAYTLSTLELGMHAFVAFAALTNIVVLARSKVLHPNLRLVLVWQSVTIVCFEAGRNTLVVLKFAYKNIFYSGFVQLEWAQQIPLMIMGLLGHVLLAERVFATVLVRRYEKYTSTFATAAMLLFVTIVCLLNTYFLGSSTWSLSLLTQISDNLALALCFVEMIVFCAIGMYNRKQYNALATATNRDYLTIKYQLSENVRTNRQLAPTFVFHFLSMIVMNVVDWTMYFRLLNDVYSMSLMFLVTSLFYSINHMGIVITVITCHPLVVRRFKLMLARALFTLVGCSRRVPPRGSAGSAIAPDCDVIITSRTIDGKVLHTTNLPDDHFEMLRRAWA